MTSSVWVYVMRFWLAGVLIHLFFNLMPATPCDDSVMTDQWSALYLAPFVRSRYVPQLVPQQKGYHRFVTALYHTAVRDKCKIGWNKYSRMQTFEHLQSNYTFCWFSERKLTHCLQTTHLDMAFFCKYSIYMLSVTYWKNICFSLFLLQIAMHCNTLQVV